VTLKITVFWDVTPCIPVEVSEWCITSTFRFEEKPKHETSSTYPLLLRVSCATYSSIINIEAVPFANRRWTCTWQWRYIPEDTILFLRRSFKHKSCLMQCYKHRIFQKLTTHVQRIWGSLCSVLCRLMKVATQIALRCDVPWGASGSSAAPWRFNFICMDELGQMLASFFARVLLVWELLIVFSILFYFHLCFYTNGSAFTATFAISLCVGWRSSLLVRWEAMLTVWGYWCRINLL
jgi:hypothetical protein